MKAFASFFLVLPIIILGQTTNTDWKTFDKSDYSINYPVAWELNQTGQMGTSFVLFSPLESKQDKFKENVNLVIQNLAGKNIDLNKFTEISENQIKTLVPNSNLIESKRVKKGREYHKIIYTASRGIFHLKFEQYYWVINNKAYILTFTSEQTKFEGFKSVGEKILNSFKLKG